MPNNRQIAQTVPIIPVNLGTSTEAMIPNTPMTVNAVNRMVLCGVGVKEVGGTKRSP